MKFLKNLIDRIYLKFTEKSFDDGVEIGILIGSLNANTELLRMFDSQSKKKLSEAEVYARIVERIWGE